MAISTLTTNEEVYNKAMDSVLTAQIVCFKENGNHYKFFNHEAAVDFLASYAVRTAVFLECDNSKLLEIYNRIIELFKEKSIISSEDFLEDPAVSYSYICRGELAAVMLNEECLNTY